MNRTECVKKEKEKKEKSRREGGGKREVDLSP